MKKIDNHCNSIVSAGAGVYWRHCQISNYPEKAPTESLKQVLNCESDNIVEHREILQSLLDSSTRYLLTHELVVSAAPIQVAVLEGGLVVREAWQNTQIIATIFP